MGFTKQAAHLPIETELYRKAQDEHPEIFAHLNAQLAADAASHPAGPKACHGAGEGSCMILTLADGSGRCLDDSGSLTLDNCAPMRLVGKGLQLAESGACLDTWSDEDPETWGFYGCHGGQNQQFSTIKTDGGASRFCTVMKIQVEQCFDSQPWHA